MHCPDIMLGKFWYAWHPEYFKSLSCFTLGKDRVSEGTKLYRVTIPCFVVTHRATYLNIKRFFFFLLTKLYLRPLYLLIPKSFGIVEIPLGTATQLQFRSFKNWYRKFETWHISGGFRLNTIANDIYSVFIKNWS